jgi:transcriptional regulator with XRE-family HTH domain
MSFGERLLETRQRRRLTQQQLAQSAGVHSASISAWECGEGSQFPRIDLVEALAGALKVDPGWLAFGERYSRKRAERAAAVSR